MYLQQCLSSQIVSCRGWIMCWWVRIIHTSKNYCRAKRTSLWTRTYLNFWGKKNCWIELIKLLDIKFYFYAQVDSSGTSFVSVTSMIAWEGGIRVLCASALFYLCWVVSLSFCFSLYQSALACDLRLYIPAPLSDWRRHTPSLTIFYKTSFGFIIMATQQQCHSLGSLRKPFLSLSSHNISSPKSGLFAILSLCHKVYHLFR